MHESFDNYMYLSLIVYPSRFILLMININTSMIIRYNTPKRFRLNHTSANDKTHLYYSITNDCVVNEQFKAVNIRFNL